MSDLKLQFPDNLRADAQALAELEHVSLEEYVLRIVAQQVGGEAAWRRLMSRGRQVSRERFLEILNKAPDVPPMPGDELSD